MTWNQGEEQYSLVL